MRRFVKFRTIFNLEKVKNTHGGVFLLVQLQAEDSSYEGRRGGEVQAMSEIKTFS